MSSLHFRPQRFYFWKPVSSTLFSCPNVCSQLPFRVRTHFPFCLNHALSQASLSLSRTSSSHFHSSLPSQSYYLRLYTRIPPCICDAWSLWFRRSRFECSEMLLRVGSDCSPVLLRTKQSQTHSVTSRNTWTFCRTAVTTPNLSRLNRYYGNHWGTNLFLTWRIEGKYTTRIKVAGIKIDYIEINTWIQMG